MNTEVLPLAITMMIGPGIMASIIFVTHERPIQVSVLYVLGILVSTAVMTAVWFGIATLLGNSASLGESGDTGAAGTVIQIALVVLLAAGALKNYLGRETIEPPKWLGSLLAATPGKALKLGLMVIPLMPSDELIMFTVGVNLVQSGSAYWEALPFVVLTALVAALPLLGYLLFHRRAKVAMPRLRDWMNANSWLVNIIVCVTFILLIV